MNEQAVHFGTPRSLVGILSTPDSGESRSNAPGFIFLNSGLLHRVGPNRLHVTMARELVAQGIVSFRLDLSGIGDSPARGGDLAIVDRWVAETREAMDFLVETTGVQQFVLAGNCSGALVALLAACRDSRTAGVVLVNFQGPKTYLRYYLRLAFSGGQLWRRLFRGSARFRTVLSAFHGWPAMLRKPVKNVAPVQRFDIDVGLAELARRRVRLLAVYCSWDQGLDYYKKVLKPLLDRFIPEGNLEFKIIPGMNHEFSLLSGQAQLRDIVCAWAARWHDRRSVPMEAAGLE